MVYEGWYALVKIRIPAKRSKYGNRKTEYNGVKYDSAAEATYAALLDLRMKLGGVDRWTRQHRVPLVVNGVKVCDMVIDFMVWEKAEIGRPVEIKGFETEAYKLKRKLFEALTGEKLTVIQAKDVR
jgi:hypothetical protein